MAAEGSLDLLETGPRRSSVTIVLAHGAGAPMDSPFLETIARGLGERGLRCVRFEFPYMRARRLTGSKKGPDRLPVLQEAYRRVLACQRERAKSLVIGGKSLGGRVAGTIADEMGVAGLVCLGYPFHPPGRPDRLRIEHLMGLVTPALIVQGERDPFGNRQEVESLPLSNSIRVVWAPDGDHSLAPRKRSGRTAEQNLAFAVAAIAAFVADLG